MKVEIWSDFMCPFCYIGKRKFEAALAQFENKAEVEVIFKSFELDPTMKRDVDYNVHEMLSAKYGMSIEEAKAANNNVTKQAASEGLIYHLDTAILTNTFDAHRLTHFASKSNKMNLMAERLFMAYFTESKHVGDHDTLADLAAEIGLNREETAKMLASDAYSEEVKADEQEAVSLGVRGVPFFVINRKYAVSGAQQSDIFLGALRKAWSEITPLTVLNAEGEHDSEQNCVDGACIPTQKGGSVK